MGNDSGIRWFRHGGRLSPQEFDSATLGTLQGGERKEPRRTKAYQTRTREAQLQYPRHSTPAYGQETRTSN